jgi:hypothetical protein
MEFRLPVEFLPVKSVEKRRGRGPIKASVVETQSNLRHKPSMSDPPTESPATRSKANKDVRVFAESQVETFDARKRPFLGPFLRALVAPSPPFITVPMESI